MDELWGRIAVLLARLEAGPAGVWLERARRATRRVSRRLGGSVRRGVEPVRPAVDAATSVAQRFETAVRPGRPPILYSDGMVTLDPDGVVVSAYYLPFGRRRIPYGRIRGVAEYPLTRGREFRVHGFAWPRQWYHRDARRAERAVGLELVTDDLLRPVLTPDDVDVVKGILREQIERHRVAG